MRYLPYLKENKTLKAMMIVRFKSSEEHEDILKKIKKMKKFTEELEDCLEEAIEEPEYRTAYHKDRDYDEEEDRYERRGRYSYPRR